MTQPLVSQRGQNVIASPIRKFLPFMQATKARGVKVYQLNSGDPDLEVPTAFFERLSQFPGKNLNYAPSPGMRDHVAAWIKYYAQFGVNLTEAELLPTVGCAEAILFAMMAVADVGDSLLVFEPLYVSYKSFATMIGVNLIPITLKNADGLALPASAEIESKITPQTKAIVLINPDNPTGKLWTDAELDIMIHIAKKHNLFLISDETYREIRFTGKASSLLARKDTHDFTILVDSVSKRFSMPGARVGCIASHRPDVMAAILKFAQARLSVGTLEQYALIPLLDNSPQYTQPVQAEYQRRRDVVYQALAAMPGVVCAKPEGAFYIFASLPVDSAEKFVRFLISDFSDQNETVMLSPMQDFYLTPNLGGNEVRIAYVLNVQDLTRAMDIVSKALKVYPGKTI